MSLDNIPTKTTIEIETVKLDEETLNSVKNLNTMLGNYVTDFGNLYLRRIDLMEESRKLDETVIRIEEEFKQKNDEFKKMMDDLDDRYPGGRLNLMEGTIQYQPGTLSRKQIAEMQKQQLAPQAPSEGEVKIDGN
jgi:hypothetical protein